ncbi:MAG: GNAT family N-acetyltransferase [Actinomycetota bacterium]|nr:GNAT family N-acetyltransferase [Actinomycetota bacterium]
MADIRRVEADRWEAVRDVRLRALRDAPEMFWATYEDEVSRPPGWWQGFIEAGAWFLAVQGDEPVGIAAAIRDDRFDPATRQLISMWVAPGARRGGVGLQLVKAVQGWAVTAGVRTLLLDVTQGNDAARRLYERCGFRFTGRSTRHPRTSRLRELEMRMELHLDR